jgi:hypothetical protein
MSANAQPQLELQQYMAPGESLLWSGQPEAGLKLRPSDAYVIPFSLMWAGFAIFWEAGVLNTEAPFFFRLWGIPFVLVGLYMVFGRFFAEAWLRARTVYGVTNQRVLIRSGLSRSLTSLPLRTLPAVTVTERPSGSGTITFGATSSVFSNALFRMNQRQSAPVFEFIPQVRSVSAVIQAAQLKAGT